MKVDSLQGVVAFVWADSNENWICGKCSVVWWSGLEGNIGTEDLYLSLLRIQLIIYAVMKWFKIMFVSFIISYISFLEVSSNVVSSKQSCQQVDLKQSSNWQGKKR